MSRIHSRGNLAQAVRLIASVASSAVLLGAGPCGDKPTEPTVNVASVQITAIPSNPRVGETTILGATPVNSGGVAVQGVVCAMAPDDPAILRVIPDGGGWRGLGLAPGTTSVRATCGAAANAVTINVRPAQVTLTVNKLGDGNGSVFINPPGGTYDMGTTVVITATALAGSTFTGWGGACPAGAGAACTLVLNSNQVATAAFALGGVATRIISLSGDLTFGTVNIGQQANAQFRITNSGNSTLTITGMTGPAGGVYTASWLSGAIAPGASQLVTVFFTPTAAQNYNGTLTVIGDQTSGTNTIPISGSGAGAAQGGTTKYDGTYDFFFKSSAAGGVTTSNNSPRYITIRNGAISSSDGAISGGSVSSLGVVVFTSPCPLNASVATWIGNMNVSALAGANFGQGTYTCSIAIGGSSNTWQVTQSR